MSDTLGLYEWIYPICAEFSSFYPLHLFCFISIFSLCLFPFFLSHSMPPVAHWRRGTRGVQQFDREEGHAGHRSQSSGKSAALHGHR